MNLNGYQLIKDPYIAEFEDVPAKKLKFKRWMRFRCYHKRVTKKWKSRYGFKRERMFIHDNLRIIAHPNNIDFLVKNL